MKNPFLKKTVHYVSDDLRSMLTVTTLKLFGIPIFKKHKKQAITVNFFKTKKKLLLREAAL